MMNDAEMADLVRAAEAIAIENAWVGVDLDGTLAEWHGWTPDIGKPISRMVEIIKEHLAAGDTVKIFTARAAGDQKAYWQAKIGDWTERVFGQRLEITCQKDSFMTRCYDDRCIQVIDNTGMPIMSVPGVYEAVQRFLVSETKLNILRFRNQG